MTVSNILVDNFTAKNIDIAAVRTLILQNKYGKRKTVLLSLL